MEMPRARPVLIKAKQSALSFGLLCLAASLLAPPPAQANESNETLRQCSDIRRLQPVEADQSRPVLLNGVVTMVPRAPYTGIVIQDATAGMWVDVEKARQKGLWSEDCEKVMRNLKVGDELLVEGVTERGGFAPVVLPSKLSVQSSSVPLPEAISVTVPDVLTGRHDVRRVRLEGVVQETGAAGHESGDTLTLKLVNTGGALLVRAPKAALPAESELLDAKLSVTGTIISQHNSRAEIDGAVLVTALKTDIVILARAKPPDQAPLLKLASLRPYEFEGSTPSRRRIIGTATLWQPGRRLMLQEGEAAVEVTTSDTRYIPLGSLVEASGFVSPPRPICRLENAVIRVLGESVPPQPAEITPSELLDASQRKHTNNWQRSVFDFHFRLVRVTGTLVETYGDAFQSSRNLLLRSEGLLIPVRWENAPSDFGEAWRPGSALAVTGVVCIEPRGHSLVTYEPVGNGDVSLLLRGATDVELLAAASWWTRSRLMNAVWSVLALAALIFFVAVSLARRVRKQAQEIALRIAGQKEAQIRFDATLAERNRLGADMHDGLQQFLAGISMQMETAQGMMEQGRDAAPALQNAKKLLLKLREEFRDCLNALRGTSAEMAMPEVLKRTAEIIRSCYDLNVRVTVEGTPVKLPGNHASNLMLVIQEAANNAVRHGKAANIQLGCRFTDGCVTLRVTDDGVGFDASSSEADTQHYGLANMRDRIERLGGSFLVESSPGQGTCIQLRLPLR